MAFDKVKALSAAEKFLSQGKIASAIQEYRKIVEHDALDFTALNTLGDLYVRTNKAHEAIAYFLRVADYYREQGFALKAIAVYKKISRLSAETPGVAHNLARLYEQQGLYVEARAQYLSIADGATRAGRPLDALEALRRIADLDPKNVETRIRLAEGYTREGMSHDAADAYVEAGELLLSAGRSQDALNAYKHAHALRPESHAVLHGLVAASTAVGAAAEAAATLAEAVADAPGDLELLAMLARTYIEAADAEAAERATDALVSAEHTNYPLWFEVAQLYLKQDAVGDAVRVLARAVEPALTGKQERAVLNLLTEALSRDHDQIEALKLVLRIHTWQRDDEGMRVTLERLADAACRASLVEEERRALEHLVRLVPFDQGYHERLSQLGDAPASSHEDDSQPDPLAPREVSRDDFGAHAHNNGNSGAHHAQPAPAFEASSAGASSRGLPASAPSEFELASFDQLAEVHDAPTQDAPPPARGRATDELASSVAEFEWNAVAEVEEPPRPARRDPSASFADLNADAADGSAPSGFAFTRDDSGAQPHAATPADPFAQINDQAHAETPAPTDAHDDAAADPFARAESSSPRGAQPSAQASERAQSMLMQELESVDFYIEQGYADIAHDTLDMLERQYGASDETAARRARLQGGASRAPVETTDDSRPDAHAEAATTDAAQEFVSFGGFELPAETSAETSAEPAPSGSLEFSIDERALLVEPEAEAAPQASAQAATHPGAASAEAHDARRARQPDAARQSQQARKSGAVDPQMASIFGEFLDAAEDAQPQSSRDDDYETHYNLGVAYKEMALWDEAVEQFQKAGELCAPGDGTPHYLACCNMLGHCLSEKGMPRAAVVWFKRALALPDLTEDESQALRYDLAAAYEQSGDIERAVDAFSEVYAVDVSYRGVAARLRELQKAVTSDK
ncbi:MAG: tetratricopeptide repeat protein [Acidobacteria bacterium]|nr:tetratricopeptide repeat protein [Acidobacteriota bacterium]